MISKSFKAGLARSLSDYGMLLVLLVLCIFFSYATWVEQHPNGPQDGTRLAGQIVAHHGAEARVLIIVRSNEEDGLFADALQEALAAAGATVTATVKGSPADARKALQQAADGGGKLDVIASNHFVSNWPLFDDLAADFPALTEVTMEVPESYRWPVFLNGDNLLNIAKQIAIIAILAVGMTAVIITGGIDLSVGSLVALSAVLATLLIRNAAGGLDASGAAMVLCCVGAIAVCGAMGLFSGLMITMFDIPPFIVTLGMMLVAKGAAFTLAEGQSIYEVPASFGWLGQGSSLGAIPNAVVLMALLYIVAHIIMTRTRPGRHIYALGGNQEGARLSGVRVKVLLALVYTACGATAGLGGVVLASQLKSGSPTYGVMYELYVIAAVVVGGTSLRGGEGRMLGTLIGAFIIAVIQNGMNLTGVESYTQNIVLGFVILGAVLLDVLKNRGWRFLKAGKV